MGTTSTETLIKTNQLKIQTDQLMKQPRPWLLMASILRDKV